MVKKIKGFKSAIWQHIRHSEVASLMVEASIAFPLVILLTMTTIDYARQIYIKSVIQDAISDGMKYLYGDPGVNVDLWNLKF